MEKRAAPRCRLFCMESLVLGTGGRKPLHEEPGRRRRLRLKSSRSPAAHQEEGVSRVIPSEQPALLVVSFIGGAGGDVGSGGGADSPVFRFSFEAEAFAGGGSFGEALATEVFSVAVRRLR